MNVRWNGRNGSVAAAQQFNTWTAASGQKEPLEVLTRHLGLESAAKKQKMATKSGDMTKLQRFLQHRSLLSCRA